ncbi:hypothetical protein TWF730_002268 [Orbilia blumenaviensis]|uniref:Uncharacterized protein n=1 Tax=Orbilia blumenaviensis TaxID=1796055 RepID=A0AAV9UBP4_9PEZI
MSRPTGMTLMMMAGGAAAAIPAGSYIYAADNPKADPIHGGTGDILTDRPKVTKCIVVALCAFVVIGFFGVSIWRFARYRRRHRRGSADVEIASVARHRRRASRRRRYREPPPPYSAAASQQPLNMGYLEGGRMTTIDGIESRSAPNDSDLPVIPAPAYKL